MTCTHKWNKGFDSNSRSAFKICSKCSLYQEITMPEYYNFEEMLLEEKIRRIVKEELNERSHTN